jgi:hypothetical protein
MVGDITQTQRAPSMTVVRRNNYAGHRGARRGFSGGLHCVNGGVHKRECLCDFGCTLCIIFLLDGI